MNSASLAAGLHVYGVEMLRWPSVVLLSIFSYGAARADVGLILNESTGKGVSGFTSAGHSAVYLSNICPASPVKLRLCDPGEQGSVLSNYTNFGESKPYEWNIVPLSVFLYGVEDPAGAPLFGDTAVLKLLQQRYRERYLAGICPENTCGDPSVTAHWRDMVGGTFVRRVYLFRVKTTPEQDARLIAEFNALPNENHYNGFTRNCADFARGVVNRYFPGAARPDHVNDFGMTSPKAISKSLTHYGEARPALDFTAERFDQLPGPIKRSSPARKGTEVSFRLKKWLIPLVLMESHELPVFVASYALTGRFNPDREVRRHPEAGALASPATWKNYRDEFQEILDTAIHDGIIASPRDLQTCFKDLDRRATAHLDAAGRPVLDLDGRHAGLSLDNIADPDSDPKLGFRIMLARVQADLALPAAKRESFDSFRKEWDTMIRMREIRLREITPAATN
jgi:hypothetical protein